MSERRRPDFTLSLTTQQGDRTMRHKLECYKSSQFKSNAIQIQRQYDDEGISTFRVRHNGVWVPPGQRTLMTLDEVMQLARGTMARQLMSQEEVLEVARGR